MKAGHTLIELLVYIAIVSLILSFVFPIFNTMTERTLLYEDVKTMKSMIRYARIVSYFKNCRVDVFLATKLVRVMLGKRTLKAYKLNVDVRGDTHFAFSNGVPYISGETKFSIEGSLPVILTVTPVIGKVNVRKLEW